MFLQLIGGVIGVLVILGLSLLASWMLVSRLVMPALAGVFGRTEVYVAQRYLFSPKKRNAINIITFISILGITIVTAALIIILSIFNGFQLIIIDMFSSFDPDLKIIPARGRVIQMTPELNHILEDHPSIVDFVPTIENKAIIKYIDKQHFVQVKGVTPEINKISPIDSLIYQGQMDFSQRDSQHLPGIVLGGGVAQIINANMLDEINPVQLFVASDDLNPMSIGNEGLITRNYRPSGYFSIQIEYDNKFVIMGFEEAAQLFGYEDQCTAMEIRLEDYRQAEEVKEALVGKLGPDYEVLTWYEQHKTLYDVMQNEKLIAYLVLTLVLLLAGVNIVGSLSMIVIEKKWDIGILKSLGMTKWQIRKLFLAEGFMVGAIGGLAGLLLALIVGLVQERFGVVKLGGGDSFLIDAWPMDMRLRDFGIIFLTVFGLSMLASWYPSKKAAELQIADALRSAS